MNALSSDMSPAPAKTPVFSCETQHTYEMRTERAMQDVRNQLKISLLYLAGFVLTSVTLISSVLGGLLSAWLSEPGLSLVNEGVWMSLLPLVLLLMFSVFYAKNSGSLWAVWKGWAPVQFDPNIDPRAETPVRYVVEEDCVRAIEPNQTEAWHFAFLSKPLRLGRFVLWRRAGSRLFFVPLPSESEAKELLQKVKHRRSHAGSAGFDLGLAPPSAVSQSISARSAFEALKKLSLRAGTPAPDRLASVASYFWIVLSVVVAAFLLWVVADSNSRDQAGFTLFKQLSDIVLATAILVAGAHTWSFAPRLRHLHHFQRGLLRGFEWGPTAVTCDTSGVEIWREGQNLRLHWPAIRAVHDVNGLTVIETTTGQVHVVPAIPSAANMLSAYHTSRQAGPWDTLVSSPEKQEQPKRGWFSKLLRIVLWMNVVFVLLGLIGLIFAKQAKADLARDADLPGWYQEVSAEDRAAALNVAAPVELALQDEKLRVEHRGYQTVRQSFFTVHDRTQLENFGQIQLHVDPNFEQATLHRLRIHRDGEVLDQLDIPFEELRREPELNAGIILGDIEYFGQITDLRVGDTVEMIWSKQAVTPVFPDQFHLLAHRPSEWGWETRRTTIDLPQDLHFGLNHPDIFNVARRTEDGRTILSWTVEKLEKDERNLRQADDWDISNDGLQLSTFKTWAQVSDGVAQDYQPRPDLLPPDLIDLLDDIARQSDDAAWRATQALRLVQDRVRYFSVSIGEGGWIPRAPDRVWLDAYGDCKDKALLLISMLDRLQVQADVVLVDHDTGPALPRMLPSPFVFNHAIVRVRDPQGDWFVDPTDLLQGGIGRAIPVKDFRWGLPLAPDTAGLVEIARTMPTEPTREIVQDYAFLEDGPTAAILNVTDTWRGVEADTMRWRYDGDDMEKRRQQYEKWYAKRFPGAKLPGQLVIEDDLDANVFRLVQRYELPRDGFHEKDLWNRLNHYGYGIAGELYEFDDDEELAGQSRVNAPLHNVHRIVMRNLPAPLSDPKPLSFENEFVSFETAGKWHEATSTWEYEWRLSTKETTLSPGDEAAWSAAEDYVDNNDHYNVYLHKKLYKVVTMQPVYLGLTATQLLFFPVLLSLAAMTAALFRKGVRAEIAEAEKLERERKT